MVSLVRSSILKVNCGAKLSPIGRSRGLEASVVGQRSKTVFYQRLVLLIPGRTKLS